MPDAPNQAPVPTVLYSTTRTWNPGDDFVLFGVRNLLAKVLPESNPVVFNRNIELHRIRLMLDRLVKLEKKGSDEQITINLYDAFLKNYVWRSDNSWRPPHGLEGIDYCVFAGTPEWMGPKLAPLTAQLLESDVPVFYLGIGAFEGTEGLTWDKLPKPATQLLERARLITVRDEACARMLAPAGPHHLPCPALFAAPKARRRKGPRRLALSLQCPGPAHAQRIEQRVHDWALGLYRRLAEAHDCALVCHYVDEAVELRGALPGVPVLYSYDAGDYLGIYDGFDLTVTTRVHGAGLCASLGIPGVVISHSARSETAEGFLAEAIDPATMTVEQALARIAALDVAKASARLMTHRRTARKAYLDLLAPHFG